MKHLGDICKINGAEIEPVDCITGGSPCQDLSIAGKRAGLAGERSGLFMEQVRIVKEMRERDRRNGRADNMVRPRFLVWENVVGAFSSNKGKDFAAVLEKIARIAEPGFSLSGLPEKWKWTKAGAIDGDGWSIAWRTHDAQYWGVPQRRRRISVGRRRRVSCPAPPPVQPQQDDLWCSTYSTHLPAILSHCILRCRLCRYRCLAGRKSSDCCPCPAFHFSPSALTRLFLLRHSPP